MRFNINIENESYKNLETVIADFEQISEKFEKQKTEASEKFKIAFAAFVSDFFKLVPSVKSVSWNQYTPYFNDGDSCTFSVNEPTFYNFIVDDDYDENEDEDTDKNQWALDSWQLHDYVKFGISEPESKLMEFLSATIQENEVFLEEIFGDHMKIILTANGIEEVEYDHD